jgi:hypothetical protein
MQESYANTFDKIGIKGTAVHKKPTMNNYSINTDPAYMEV